MVQEIENRISKAEGAAELGAAAVEGNSLLADFLQMDGDVRGAACIVELDVNVFFAHGFEITGSGQLREANFEGALVEWVAFAQGNSAADEAITKSVQTLELEAVDEIGRRIAKVEFEADGMFVGIKNGVGVHRREGNVSPCSRVV